MSENHKRARIRKKLFLLSLLISPIVFAQEVAIDPGTWAKDIYINRNLGFMVKLAPGLAQDKQAISKSPLNQ